jgi:hypothetical protein
MWSVVTSADAVIQRGVESGLPAERGEDVAGTSWVDVVGRGGVSSQSGM